MAEALRAKAVAPQQHRDAEQRRDRKRRRLETLRESLASKTFEDLTPQERNKLLKLVAVRLGLIKDSDDA